jgi:hypothetical protein
MYFIRFIEIKNFWSISSSKCRAVRKRNKVTASGLFGTRVSKPATMQYLKIYLVRWCTSVKYMKFVLLKQAAAGDYWYLSQAAKR